MAPMIEHKMPKIESIKHPVFIELVKSNVITQIEARPLSGKWYIHLHLNGQPRVLTSKRNDIRRFANPASLISYAKNAGLRNVLFSFI